MLKKNKSNIRLQPAHMMIIMFTSVIAVGTVLLSLPMSRLQPISYIDALFTATSATCVTGLLTVNVMEQFTTFGQVVILALMELGGLGIMTASTIFMIMLGKSISLRDSSAIHGSFSASQKIDVRKLMGSVLTLMLVFEAVAALIFTALWTGEMGFKRALYEGIFHAVSAFCNAGISTFHDGFIGMEKQPLVNLVSFMLIVAGSFGFIAVSECYQRMTHRGIRRSWSLQTRMIALYTFILLLVGWLGFLAFEVNNTLAGRPLFEQLSVSLFHSASGRTAGFSNIDPREFHNSTLYLYTILMYIGGAPGSVAGGIKITTFAVLIGMAISRYNGHERVHAFNHAVPEEIVSRSISIVFLSIITIVTFVTLLLVAESAPGANPADTRASFLPIMFEVVSAYGTVGASMGITSSLSTLGKALIILLMFIGRLGPLTIAIAVGSRKKASTYELSEESVMVG